MIMYEMVQGRPPWEYKCPPSCSLEVYYQGITSFVMGCQQDLRTCSETPCSHDLCTLIRQLLTVNPDKRLGRNGAAEVCNVSTYRRLHLVTVLFSLFR